MAHSRRTFSVAFAIALAAQLALWILYWFFGLDSSGRETTFQRVLLGLYWPVLRILEFAMEPLTWWRLGFLISFGPLIGAAIYSLGIGIATIFLRKGGNASEQTAA
ncbi:MAG TPA: hypothetical protein VH600_16870 [Burkholderiales bacterium]|jgi:hypothetical protein